MAIENTYLLGKNITLGCGFDLQAKAPLDSRQTVPAFAGLQALIDGNAAYEGMIVYDEETKKTYQAQMVDGALAFREFGINEAELKDLIASETTAAMEFKGVATALPENPSKGDFYKVTASFEVAGATAKIGDSIVYDGTQWFIIPSGDDIEDTWRPVTDVDNDASLTFAAGDKLDVAVAANGTVTYSHEAIDAPTATPVGEDEQTRTYITSVETDGHGHITGYKTATENVEDTNTEYTFEGQSDEATSVYFQVTSNEEGASAEVIYLDAYSKNETNTELAKKVDKVEGKSLIDDSEIARLATLANYDDTKVKEDIAKKADAEEMATELGKKVDKVDGKDLISTSEIERLATLKNYDDTEVKADIAKKADAETMTTELGKKVDKVDGYSLVADTEIARLADVDNYDDEEVRGLIGNNAKAIEDFEAYVGTIPTDYTETNVISYINKKAEETLAAAQGGSSETAASVKQQLDNYKSENDTRVKAVEDNVALKADKTQVATDIENAVKAETERATGVENGLAGRIKDLEDNKGGYATTGYVDEKASDAQTAAEATAAADATMKADLAELNAKMYVDVKVRELNDTLTELGGKVTDAETAIAAEKSRAEGIEGGLRTDVDDVADRMTTAEGKIADLETESAKHAIKTEVEGALALKADKSVVDAMYTNDQIDGFIAEVKKYADDNDADTKYGIVYDSDNKKIKLVEGGSDVEIDASAFIKDGMISNVTIGDDNDLVITFNTDAGKENIVLPLDQLVDIYTGVEGARVKVTVNSDKSISADLVAGSISKNYLDNGVQASLALADSALQSHQDISHLATKTELQGVDGKFANYNTTVAQKAIDDEQDARIKQIEDSYLVTSDIQPLEEAIADVKTTAEAARTEDEVNSQIDAKIAALELGKTYEPIGAEGRAIAAAEGKVNALAGNVYTKEETYTKPEVEALLTWGSF